MTGRGGSPAADAFLREAASALPRAAGARIEFSIRLADPAGSDRLILWVPGRSAEARAGAEALVRHWSGRTVPEPGRGGHLVALGLGVAAEGGRVERRLYRQVARPGTWTEAIEAWRWAEGERPAARHYAFHFLPETADGRRPCDLVHPDLGAGFAALSRHPRALATSGFWLRRAGDGAVDQVDMVLPWDPTLGEVLAAAAPLPPCPGGSRLGAWSRLPIRHLAARPDGALTAYSSAELDGAWPRTASELRRRVWRGAAAEREALAGAADPWVGPRAAGPADAPDRDAPCGADVAAWRRVLGPDMHGHAGLFPPGFAGEPDDAAMDAAMREAVRTLYPHLPEGCSVYDVGCGWGGPLGMLSRERGCRALGLTASRAQFRHASRLGLSVRWGDPERTLPPGRFDCALMLESLGPVSDKGRLLAGLRPFAGRLVMRVDGREPTSGGGPRGVDPAALAGLLAAAGWRVTRWRDRRAESLPSFAGWRRRFARLPPTGDPALELFRRRCLRAGAMARDWAASCPLIEVVAE